MARNLGPKHALCRRLGERICSSDKCPSVRRPYPKGAHGPEKSRRQPSGYGVQFLEKQKAKSIYGILERQFRGTYEEAKRRTGNTAEALVELLESRLDNVVFRLGFAKTRDQARQLVSHGHIFVNGKPVTVPSYRVRPGVEVSIAPRARLFKHVVEHIAPLLAKHTPPSWLLLDAASLSGKMLERPSADEARAHFDPTRIVEFYSR